MTYLGMVHVPQSVRFPPIDVGDSLHWNNYLGIFPSWNENNRGISIGR